MTDHLTSKQIVSLQAEIDAENYIDESEFIISYGDPCG